MLNLNLIRKNKKKVIGLNERYLEFIRPHNKGKAIAIADDKLLTKKILRKHDIPVPEAIAVIKNGIELENFDFNTLPNSFVIKPVHGTRGGGVEIFYNKDKEGKWIRGEGSKMSPDDLKGHIKDVLDGRYSLHNEPDTALIEERIRPTKSFRYYTYKGTPDVRIIIMNNIPVMGMLRLPTKESLGKANLDQGAIGSGIDMAVGKTTTSIMGKAGYLEYVPETKIPLSGLKIPYWDKILRYSIEASKVTGLGFAAIDFLIDEDKGPVIIELNARPGLSIQLANDDGMRWRLKKASGLKVKSTEQGIRLAKDLFGGEIEEEIEAISGKQVIGLIETVKVYGKEEVSEEVKGKIDTGATISSIDTSLAIHLGFGETLDFATNILKDIPESFESNEAAREYSKMHKLEERLKENENIVDTAIIASSHGISYRIQIEVEFELSGIRFPVKANIADRSNLVYSVLVGQRDLKKFLIDPNKKL